MFLVDYFNSHKKLNTGIESKSTISSVLNKKLPTSVSIITKTVIIIITFLVISFIAFITFIMFQLKG